MRGRFSGRWVAVLIHGCGAASAREVRRDPTFGLTPGSVGFPGWGGVENSECYRFVLRATPGYRFLAALANAAGVRVQGAVHGQEVRQVARLNWRLDGATMTVGPGGSGLLYDPHHNIGLGELTNNPENAFLF